MNRRRFLQATAAGAATLALSRRSLADSSNPDLSAIQKEIEKRHDESVARLQQWIRQPSIAAEHRRSARHLCHARRRRATNHRALLHV